MNQSPSPTIPNQNKGNRKLKIIVFGLVVLLIITAGVVFYPILRTIYIQNNWIKLGSDQVNFSVVPASIRPGQSFSIIANFQKAYNFGNNGWYNTLEILDATGREVLLTPSELLNNLGYKQGDDLKTYNQLLTTAANTIDTQSGFFPATAYAQLQTRRTNPNSYFIEDIGCALGLGPPSDLPTEYTDTLTFVALPQTPPGTYSILIKPGTYCNGLPISITTFQITVLQATP